MATGGVRVAGGGTWTDKVVGVLDLEGAGARGFGPRDLGAAGDTATDVGVRGKAALDFSGGGVSGGDADGVAGRADPAGPGELIGAVTFGAGAVVHAARTEHSTSAAGRARTAGRFPTPVRPPAARAVTGVERGSS